MLLYNNNCEKQSKKKLLKQTGDKMELTILIENNTLVDKYLTGEPGLAIFIEENGKKILFDSGYSDAFIKNASAMNIDLAGLDYVVLSHGHNDHTWGLEYLIEKRLQNQIKNKPILITHPLSFSEKFVDTEKIGIKLTKEELSEYFNLKLAKAPLWISEKLVFLGEIPRKNSYESKKPLGKIKINGNLEDDYLFDDSALVYKSDKGLVIITGCSHSGICNITEHAKKICNEDSIVDIIGGFHLLKPSANVLKQTAKYLNSQKIVQIHPCHCTDLKSKVFLSQTSDLKEVGVGLKLKY